MRCELRSEELSAYCDNELDAARRAELEAHVKECAACSERLSEYRQTSARLRETKESPLAESFVLRVRSRIRTGSDEQVSWIPAERLARRLVFALALIVIVTASSFWGESEPVSGIVEGYYQVTQQDSALVRMLNADTAPTKDDVLLAVMAK